MPVAKVPSSGFIPPCIPTCAPKPPVGTDWVHEIKHDGYRLQVRRAGETVRLFTRQGYDWTDRYPSIARAAAKLRARSFTIDGEAAVCGPDGIAVFDALHQRGTVTEAMLFAFDLLELDGVDYRPLSLRERKLRLSHLVDRRLAGIAMNDHTDARGDLVFEQACRMGLEGIVSKRLSKPYQSGRSGHWLKVKNPDSPAMVRHREGQW
jgi:bifunctional non-homologous end joining protein LigD